MHACAPGSAARANTTVTPKRSPSLLTAGHRNGGKIARTHSKQTRGRKHSRQRAHAIALAAALPGRSPTRSRARTCRARVRHLRPVSMQRGGPRRIFLLGSRHGSRWRNRRRCGRRRRTCIPVTSAHAQVFSWMACDQLAAFFALPPSQLLVGPQTARRPPPARPPPPAGAQPLQGLPGERAGAFDLTTAGGRGGRARGGAYGVARGRGRGRGAGRVGPAARARANSWIQCAAEAGQASSEVGIPGSEAAQVPAAALGNEAGTGTEDTQPGGKASKWRNGVKSAKKKNLPVAPKQNREMLWDGKNAGSLPNMMWRAVSMEDLRQVYPLPLHTPLPPFPPHLED